MPSLKVKWKNLLHMSSLDKNEANVPINSRAQKELLFYSVLAVVGLRAVGAITGLSGPVGISGASSVTVTVLEYE